MNTTIFSKSASLLTSLVLLLAFATAHAKPPVSMKSYYPNGNLNDVERYKEGKKHGVSESWYEDGVLESQIAYKEGQKHGLYTTYHENGKRSFQINYTEGKENGIFEAWYVSGRLASRAEIVMGLIQGEKRSFSEKGELVKKEMYRDNIKIN